MVLTSNPKAADALYSFVLNNFATVTTLNNGLAYALQAMTANWITPARAQQVGYCFKRVFVYDTRDMSYCLI